MRGTGALLTLAMIVAACKSFDAETSKYVEVRDDVGGRYFTKRKEIDNVNRLGQVTFKDLLSAKEVTLKRSRCTVRGVRSITVTNERAKNFYYDGTFHENY